VFLKSAARIIKRKGSTARSALRNNRAKALPEAIQNNTVHGE
jgi:hypothetical protein